MNINELIRICKAYSKLGWAIQGQLDKLIEGETGMNPNAIREIERSFLKILPAAAQEELKEALSEFRKAAKK